MSQSFSSRGDEPVFVGGALGKPTEPTYCQRHPEVEAVLRCKACLAPICATCDFQFPGGFHFCPTCATQTSQPISASRKSMLAWSYVAAIWVTVFLAFIMTGALGEAAAEEPGATIVGTLIFLPGLIGLGLAISSCDSRAGNSVAVWISLGWNILLFVTWVGLMILGLTMA